MPFDKGGLNKAHQHGRIQIQYFSFRQSNRQGKSCARCNKCSRMGFCKYGRSNHHCATLNVYSCELPWLFPPAILLIEESITFLPIRFNIGIIFRLTAADEAICLLCRKKMIKYLYLRNIQVMLLSTIIRATRKEVIICR